VTRDDTDVDVEDDIDAEDGGAPLGPRPWVPIAALVLSLLGVADSTYLTIAHFQVHALVCPANAVICCTCVTTGPWSTVFGIPVAIFGLAFYLAMTAVNLPPLWRSTDVRLAWLRLAMAVTGIGFVIYLVYVELFIKKYICEYCTGVHIVTLALFILIVTTFPSMLAPRRYDWDDSDPDPAV
jgi:uncharacterized membrane protein